MYTPSLARSFYIFIFMCAIFLIILLVKEQFTIQNYDRLRTKDVFEEWVRVNHGFISECANKSDGINTSDNIVKYEADSIKESKSDTLANDESEMKYILQWTSPNTVPFVYMGQGQKGFIENKCPNTNCFVTNNRGYFSDMTKFDVVLFHGPELININQNQLPTKRAPHQKFVFATIESSDNYAVCNSNIFNNYFNWTWTYRLDSEVKWGYVIVRNHKDEVIGPKIDMHWMKVEDMDPVSDEVRERVKSKTKAAAWFVSNCRARSDRGAFVKDLQNELKKYKLEVDIYGNCGKLQCPPSKDEHCKDMLAKDYYFYLSFENSFSEYYVTEKLVTALENFAVPIVFGAANYTRFMPDGIYLNARELGYVELAKTMNDLIKDHEKYLSYFKWRNHYVYHRMNARPDTNTYCNMCMILHNREMMKKHSTIDNFAQWWNPPGRC